MVPLFAYKIMKKLSEKQKLIFMGRIKKNENGCWNWIGGKFSSGYGAFSIGGKNKLAHRISYLMNTGTITNNMSVCHSCDNPSCVNPEHLWLGTAMDNVQDKIKKGRSNPPAGERQWLSKLTGVKIIEIRKKYQSGKFTQKILGDIYGVGQSNISYVINKTWKHLYA